MIKYLIKIKNQFLRMFYPFICLKYRHIQVLSISESLENLIHHNYSLSRFGDGEIQWLLLNNKNSFEKNSVKLRNNLIRVLKSNNNKLKIGLPGVLYKSKILNIHSRRFYRLVMVKYGNDFLKYLSPNKQYYNTDVSRCYIGYKNRNESQKNFIEIKRIWNNRNVLIVEGSKSRLGLNNNLFKNANSIKRIECPPVNAFEHYKDILNSVKSFLIKHKNYLTLISLGPTATVLSCDLCNDGFRAIDIGHLDLEYEWFLMRAERKIDIPTRDVNEVRNGSNVITIKNNEYDSEIIKRIS